jgi:microcompartment protein CcmK/EutM
VKDRKLGGQRLLVVQPLTAERTPTGKQLICADWTGAGAGETVYYCRGIECSFPFLPAEVPTDATIVGIVDSLHINRAARTEMAEAQAAASEPARPRARGRTPRR